jgi:hypothetical protein
MPALGGYAIGWIQVLCEDVEIRTDAGDFGD